MDGALHGDFGARFAASEVDGQAQSGAADRRVGRIYEQERELLEHLAAGGAAAGPRHRCRDERFEHCRSNLVFEVLFDCGDATTA